MKSLLITLLLITGYCHAANLSFDLNDLGLSGSLGNRRVYVHPDPSYFPKQSGGELITVDSRNFLTSTNGTYTLSNVVQGVYRVEIVGPTAFPPKPNTVFRIEVPQTTSTIEVDDYIVIPTGFLLFDDTAANTYGKLIFDT